MNKNPISLQWFAAGIALCALAGTAQAALVSSGYVAQQGAKANLQDAAPPPLETAVANARSAFLANVLTLGRGEFEGGSGNFGYGTGHTASLSGGATVVNGDSLSEMGRRLGRYNMTPGLPELPSGFPSFGSWVASSMSFTYSLSTAVSAMAFFATDLGDFDGSIELELLLGTSSVFKQALDTVGSLPGTTPQQAVNGNLVFFGVVGTSSSDTFNQIRFNLTQVPGGEIDWVGIDSLILGTTRLGTTPPPPNTVPLPSSLALVGLALALMGGLKRRRA